MNNPERINDFKERVKEDPEYCLELYEYSTIRLLAHKYAYYILNGQFIEDVGYDGEEHSWYIMGMALGLLKEDETSPCVGFDYNHPLAKKGIELAKRLKLR